LGRGSRHVEEARLDDDVAVENLSGHHLVGGFNDLLPGVCGGGHDKAELELPLLEGLLVEEDALLEAEGLHALLRAKVDLARDRAAVQNRAGHAREDLPLVHVVPPLLLLPEDPARVRVAHVHPIDPKAKSDALRAGRRRDADPAGRLRLGLRRRRRLHVQLLVVRLKGLGGL